MVRKLLESGADDGLFDELAGAIADRLAALQDLSPAPHGNWLASPTRGGHGRLTRKAIETIDAGRELRDHEVSGLSIWRSVRASGWSLTYKGKDGQRRRLKLGNYPDLGIKEARVLARQWRVRICNGEDPRATPPERPRPITVAKALDRYEKEHLVDLRRGDEVVRALRREILPAVGDLALADLRRSHVVGVFNSIKPRAPVMANSVLASTVAFLNWAVAVDLLEVNPLQGLRRAISVKRVSRDRVLSDDELAQIWRGTLGLGSYGAAIRVLMLTGQRRAEIGGLQGAWLNADGWVDVPAAFYKTGRPHRFFLTDLARAQLMPPDARGRYFGTIDWGHRKAVLDAEADVRDWVVHDLRRTFASGLQRLGESSEVIELCLGHACQGVTATYQRHQYANERQAAFERWSDFVRSLINPAPAEHKPRPTSAASPA